MSFAKLDSGIVNSTLWVQPDDVLRVWIWLLSQADANGEVRTAAPALALICMKSVDRIREILTLLESPDPDSRSEVEDGRRIRRISGGWQIINYRAYRERVAADEKRENDRVRIAEKRAAARSGVKNVAACSEVSRGVANVAQAEAEVEEEAEAEKQQQQQKRQRDNAGERSATTSGRDGRRGARLPDGWEPSEAVREWARSEFPAVSLANVLPEFVDYWQSIPGQRGCKLDWDATFRNRVREVAARQPRNPRGTHRESAADRVARRNAEAERGSAGVVIEGDFDAR